MNNEQPHINPWAEKLQQAPMPDADASWIGMERLLDQHLPEEKKEKKRRFFFILFPVILLGIGLMLLGSYLYTTAKQQQAAGNSDLNITVSGSSISLDTTSFQDSGSPEAVTATEKKVSNTFPVDIIMADSVVRIIPAKQQTTDAITGTHLASSNATSLKEPVSTNNNYPTKYNSISHKEKITADKKGGGTIINAAKLDNKTQVVKGNNVAGVKRNKRKPNTPTEAYTNSGEENIFVSENKRKGWKTNVVAVDGNKTVAGKSTIVQDNSFMHIHLLPAFRKPVNPLQQLILKDHIDQLRSSVLLDSMLSAMKKNRSELVKKGWTFSVGVNHFVRINSQQPAPYKGNETTTSSDGLAGKITDYLPVPQARYYFNNKVFVQGELQFNAPQFTQPVQLEHKNYSDGVFNVNDTAYLKKLTYFNLPISIHYSPVKRFYIGAGMQYSRLNNAIVLHQETKVRAGSQFPDSSIISSKQERINGDTLFQKLHTTELRLLADVSYQTGPLGVGIRYNHSLRDLVKIPVSGGTVTQARNSSLQLYIRYRFLDKRKLVKPKSK